MPDHVVTFVLLLAVAALAVALLLVTGSLRRARAALASERAAQAAREDLLFACLALGVTDMLARSAARLGARHAWLWLDAAQPPTAYAWSSSGVDSAAAADLRARCQAALDGAPQARLDDEVATLCARVEGDGTPPGVLALRAAPGTTWSSRDLDLVRVLARVAAHLLAQAATARATATQAEAQQRAYLGTLSHRLRTPMTAVLGFAQILEMDTNLSHEQREFVGEIIAATESLLQRLNEAVGI